MQSHEFYAKYANTPIKQRGVYFGYKYRNLGATDLTLNKIYTEMSAIDDKIRADVIRKQQLLDIAGKYYHHTKNDL